MKNIEEIYEMLDWKNSEVIQLKGIELGKHENIGLFFQPYNKEIWENCAKIVSSNSNEKLEKYIYDKNAKSI